MTRCALLVLTVGLLIAADSPKEKEDTGKKDLKKLEGTWVLASGVDNGKKVPASTLENAKLTIKGDKHTVKVGDTTYKGTHELDSTKSPKTIDITDTEGPFKGKTVKGIYELKGDQFRICYADVGKDRPKNFAAKAESGHHSHVWKRAKK